MGERREDVVAASRAFRRTSTKYKDWRGCFGGMDEQSSGADGSSRLDPGPKCASSGFQSGQSQSESVACLRWCAHPRELTR